MSSKIEWLKGDDGVMGETWNPVTGCSPVSEGCASCYAARMAKRLAGRCGYPKDNPFRVVCHPDRLDMPIQWKKPRRIFVNSMGDLFHSTVTDRELYLIFQVMLTEKRHTYMILTKRPERMKQFFEQWIADSPPHIWLGVTAENQRTADERIPILFQIPAAVRFVSCEPLLGPIDLTDLHYQNTIGINALKGSCGVWEPHTSQEAPRLDWVIAGAETGPGARPMVPHWAGHLWRQCKQAEIPFFFKKWGGYYPQSPEVLDMSTGEWKQGIWADIESTRQFPEVKR